MSFYRPGGTLRPKYGDNKLIGVGGHIRGRQKEGLVTRSSAEDEIVFEEDDSIQKIIDVLPNSELRVFLESYLIQQRSNN